MIHFEFNMMWILLQLYNDSGLWTMLRAMLGCSSPRVTSTNVHSRWDLHKIQLTRTIKTRSQDGEARPADLETIFFDFEVPSSKYSCRHDFSLEILVDVILIKSNLCTVPNFCDQWPQFPRLGWRGRCVVIKSVSTQRQRPSIFRFPISSIHKSFCLSEIFFACYLITLLFRISAKCSPTWYYQKLNLVQVWSS